MKEIRYNVGELKRIIKESANEFDAKVGAGVKDGNKRNNEKSYKDAEKASKDFDGGLKNEKKGKLQPKLDGNRTTLEYNPRMEASDAYKKRVEAQAKGYTSELEEKNKIEKAAEFDNDGKIFKNFKDAADKRNKIKTDIENSGICGQNLKEYNKGKNTMYENMTPKRLKFKHTKFLNEAQMLARIPEEYKVNGQKIYMQDANDNEYIVECALSEKTGIIETNVVSYKNDKIMNEQVERINQLFGYKRNADMAPTKAADRINESKSFQEMMDLSRSMK